VSPDRIRPGSAGGEEPARPPEDVEVAEVSEVVPPAATAPQPPPPPAAAEPREIAEEPIVAPPAAQARGFFSRLYYGETRVDFVRRRRIWFTISGVVLLAGVVSLATRGLNLGIDFVGGSSWTVKTTTLTIPQVQSDLPMLSGETITVLGTGATRNIQVEAKLPKGQSQAQAAAVSKEVAAALASAAHADVSAVSIDSVGPSWGGQITHKAIEALIVFFVLIAVYISAFFEWRMAFAAIIAVLHDILVTVGIYSLTGLEVTPDTVVAFLTILGYSLYDTIVVFDRVRDNLRHLSVRDRLTISDLVNLSMNQTLARSINTSLVAIMPILAVLVLGAQVLGATTLQYFGLALLVGLTTGAYSSIFIASPLVAMLKEREPRYRQLRERLLARGGERLLLSALDVARSPSAEVSARGAPGDQGERAGGLTRPNSPRASSPGARPQLRRPASRNRPRGGRR